ncbi:uncharacterized protein B0H18DRAFT_898035 [Fomitopsis serialis]|uniref:uncharacterized protein n=1 Tax=Fomitopsis serialis TaxID=139415 RepID=UPI002008A9EE|nr:uncharacterized protein B0H18DRAFT_898035 [Neoantrodia serialis]KAH9907686.1 hypothetical protein B0H18DRAFT_898035 [Neoantrodia serialis]
MHLSITPDVLHQLYQGVFKHAVTWCQELLTAEELDSRLRCLPPAYGIRHFRNGISSLSQISGKERKEMARVLLACLVGKVSKSTMLTFRSLLDFIYLAQYPTHDDTTLEYMEDALKMFHANKQVLVNLGIWDDFNIPKIHSLLHYVQSIRLFGMTDNYNTEMFERLHIDFVKDTWRASNHRDEFPQMMRWITRNEKMALYEMFQRECQAEEDAEHPEDEEHAETAGTSIKIAKYAPAPQQNLAMVQTRHHAPGFTTALVQFINTLQPDSLRLNRQDLSRTWLPFQCVDVFHKFAFTPYELDDRRIDIDVSNCFYTGTRAGRMKVIFALPRKLPVVQGGGSAPPWWPRGPLAYVEWYTRFAPAADSSHLMYSVKKPPSSSNGLSQGKIIPLSQIRQSCQLTPIFPSGPCGTVPDSWSSENMLEMASTFYVNNWGGLYAYQTLW